jgi:hypothetical protein
MMESSQSTMILNGTYKFYLDDKLIHEEKNALTVGGRAIALKSLLGIIPNFGNAIAYGIGDKPNTVDSSSGLIRDNSLQFEIGKTAVNASTLDVNNNTSVLVYSGVLDDPFEYTIHEVGLFPSIVKDIFIGLRSSTIFTFNEVDNFVQFGSASASFLSAATGARIGSDMLFLPEMNEQDGYLQYPSSSDELDYLDTYAAEDIFKLAGYDSNESSSSVVFKFYSNDSSYYELIFNTPSASGYFISEVLKYDVATVGSPNWADINFVRFWRSGGTGELFLDGLRIDTGSYLLDTNTGMISRAVLTEPIRKPIALPLTIEYSLNVGFNEGL